MEPTKRQHHTPTRTAKIKKTDNPKCWRGCGALVLPAGGGVEWRPPLEIWLLFEPTRAYLMTQQCSQTRSREIPPVLKLRQIQGQWEPDSQLTGPNGTQCQHSSLRDLTKPGTTVHACYPISWATWRKRRGRGGGTGKPENTQIYRTCLRIKEQNPAACNN